MLLRQETMSNNIINPRHKNKCKYDSKCKHIIESKNQANKKIYQQNKCTYIHRKRDIVCKFVSRCNKNLCPYYHPYIKVPIPAVNQNKKEIIREKQVIKPTIIIKNKNTTKCYINKCYLIYGKCRLLHKEDIKIDKRPYFDDYDEIILPVDMIDEICKYLPYNSRRIFSMVCKMLYNYIDIDTSKLTLIARYNLGFGSSFDIINNFEQRDIIYILKAKYLSEYIKEENIILPYDRFTQIVKEDWTNVLIYDSYPYEYEQYTKYKVVHEYRGINIHNTSNKEFINTINQRLIYIPDIPYTVRKIKFVELISNIDIKDRDLILTLLNIDGRLLWRFNPDKILPEMVIIALRQVMKRFKYKDRRSAMDWINNMKRLAYYI